MFTDFCEICDVNIITRILVFEWFLYIANLNFLEKSFVGCCFILYIILYLLFGRKRAESDTSVPDAAEKAEKFAQRWFFLSYFFYIVVCCIEFSNDIFGFCIPWNRYADILEDFKKDPESHGGPPDCIVCSILFLALYHNSLMMCLITFFVFSFLTFWLGDSLGPMQTSWANT